MAQSFPYTYTCEVCGGTFYSKVDPSGWHHHKCNKCSGKNYKDYPVNNSPSYQPKPVPTAKPVYNNVPAAQVPKKEFNLTAYIAEMLEVYGTIKVMADQETYTIPEDCICSWTTSIMIQKQKYYGG